MLPKFTIFLSFFIWAYAGIVVGKKMASGSPQSKPVVSVVGWTFIQPTVHMLKLLLRNSLQQCLNFKLNLLFHWWLGRQDVLAIFAICEVKEYIKWTPFSPSLWGRIDCWTPIGSPGPVTNPLHLFEVTVTGQVSRNLAILESFGRAVRTPCSEAGDGLRVGMRMQTSEGVR